MAVPDIQKPFRDAESAAEWIARELHEKGRVTREIVYALRIVSQITRNDNEKTAEIFRRLPPDAAAWGCQPGGCKNVAASVLLRGNAGAGAGDTVGRPEEENEVADCELLEQYARACGCWYDDLDAAIAEDFPYLAEGGEARVFRFDGQTVAKRIAAPGDAAVQQLLDRISLHNFLFPETNLTVCGFGRSADGRFSVAVLQPYVRGKSTHLLDTARMVADAGFHIIDGVRVPYLFFTENYCLGDLHELNVLTDEDGDLNVIDCDIRLNEPGLGYGGKWTVPERSFSERSVGRIGKVLSRIVPQSIPAKEFFRAYDPDGSIRAQLRETGRHEGFVSMAYKYGGTIDVLVRDDPDDGENVLVSSCVAAEEMLRNDLRFSEDERALLSNGFSIARGGSRFAFDPDTGSVRAVQDMKLERQQSLGAEIPEEARKENEGLRL